MHPSPNVLTFMEVGSMTVNQLKAELGQTTDHGGGDPLTVTTTDAATACEVLLGCSSQITATTSKGSASMGLLVQLRMQFCLFLGDELNAVWLEDEANVVWSLDKDVPWEIRLSVSMRVFKVLEHFM
ncbi:hypothetical protein V6N13_145611 [Hibiscus sabdariffa]|uniref:Uncharacterized protein n=1 Tax=Hibiscus sabdariffa TaxID=183260 RepID=A0ABR2TQY2_9ROSI